MEEISQYSIKDIAHKVYEQLLRDKKIYSSEQVKDAFIAGFVRGYKHCYDIND